MTQNVSANEIDGGGVGVPEPFAIAHFELWAQQLVLDDGNRWRPETFQLEFIEDVFSGAPECWLIVPEGNGKTTLVAALALYALRFSDEPFIPVAASSRDQARIMYRQAKGFIRRSGSDLNGDGLRIEGFDGYRRIDLRRAGPLKGETLGSIEIHAADADTGDGVIPYPFAILDELHRHRDLDLYETWRGKLAKRGAQLVTISTAGEPGTAFEETREEIRRSTPAKFRSRVFARLMSPQLVMHEWAVPEDGDTHDLALVAEANPLSTVTPEVLAEKLRSPTLTEAHWRRFTCNLATRSERAAVSEIEWHAAKTDEVIPEGERIWVGLDLGFSQDTTAVVPLWVRDAEFRLLGPAAVLEPPRDGTQVKVRDLEARLRALHARNPIERVVMDPRFGAQIAEWIEDELGARVEDRSQANKAACEDFQRFMEALREGWLKHTGDPALTRHVLNAVAKVLPQGEVRFERPRGSHDVSLELARRRWIDALVAAAMVHSVAAEQFTVSSPFAMAW